MEIENKYSNTNNDDPVIKIFVSAHKPSVFINNEIFVPIKLQASVNKEEIKSKENDNTGDNISEEKPRFCELTTQYWAWKNTKADYYGFFHYRRYFSFNTKNEYKTSKWGNVEESYLSDALIEKYGFDESSIKAAIRDADVVLPKRKDINKFPGSPQNVRKQYSSLLWLHDKDLDVMLQVIQEKYPAYYPYAQSFMNDHYIYLNNMFIMKKDLFFEYSEWLFDILFECNKRIDYSEYSAEGMRTPGHLAERLLNVYIAYLKDNKGIEIRELQTVLFMNTTPIPNIKQAFSENNTAIVLIASEYFVPYVSVLLRSIKENISIKNNYDILMFTMDISEKNRKKLCFELRESENISLRFIDISFYKERFSHLYTRGHFKTETYFRFLLPELLPDYSKVLYLDSDMIVMYDPAELFQTDVEGFLLAAAHDPDTAGLYNGYEPNKKEYMDKVLKIQKPYEYFQAGTILFNLEEFREKLTSKQLIDFAYSNHWELLDQDVLNYFAQGNYKAIDLSWNVMMDMSNIRVRNIIQLAPEYLRDEYLKARKHPNIVHFAGPEKPWTNPDCDFSSCFWKYARKSEYYELIIQRVAQAGGLSQDAQEVYRSMSYRLGNMIVNPFHKLRTAFRLIRTIGFQETTIYTKQRIEKIFGK